MHCSDYEHLTSDHRLQITKRKFVQLFQYFQMCLLEIVHILCLAFVVGMESRIKTNSPELVNWLFRIGFRLFLLLLQILVVIRVVRLTH